MPELKKIFGTRTGCTIWPITNIKIWYRAQNRKMSMNHRPLTARHWSFLKKNGSGLGPNSVNSIPFYYLEDRFHDIDSLKLNIPTQK